MSTPTDTAGPPVIIQYEDISALPVGIVADCQRRFINRYIKTSNSTWSMVAAGTEDHLLQKLVDTRANSISPQPEGPLEIVNSAWNLNILAKAAVQQGRALRVSRERQRVLERRNEQARRALSGIEEDA